MNIKRQLLLLILFFLFAGNSKAQVLSDSIVDYSIVDTTKRIKGSKCVINLNSTESAVDQSNVTELHSPEDVYANISFDLPNGGQSSEILVEVSCGKSKNIYCKEVFSYSDLVHSNQVTAKNVSLNPVLIFGGGSYIVSVTLQYPNKIQGPTISQIYNE